MIRRWLARWVDVTGEVERLQVELHVASSGKRDAELARDRARQGEAIAVRQSGDAATRIGRVRDALESGEDPETVLGLVAEAVRHGRHHHG